MSTFGNMQDLTGLLELLPQQLLQAPPASINSSNITGLTGTSFGLPITILESFVPGYGLIRKIALDIFGFDISIFVSLLGFIFLFRTVFNYTYDFSTTFVSRYLTVSVEMEERDDAFDPLMAFFVKNNLFRRTRSLKTAGPWWERLMASPRRLVDMSDRARSTSSNSSAIFNYDLLEVKKPLGFEPAEGMHRVWHRGRLYWVTLELKKWQVKYDDTMYLTISTLGFRTSTLIRFLEEARRDNDKERDTMTAIYRANHHHEMWERSSTRPNRPLNTVALETSEKLRIVRDINDYVHPIRARWYSSRGIPYRRGYLFSGPPGTGKSSLSIALAGVFGLGLYAVNLNDSNMTEERMQELFSELPDRCIVLLEDIDSAGLGDKRDSDAADAAAPAKAGPVDPNDPNAQKNKRSRSGITLAGLLNVIDGVASHEGHVLIMTTNHPEKLDPALKRPGRVDMHIAFTLATKFQAREIFLRMYTDEIAEEDRPAATTSLNKEKSKPVTPAVQTIEDVCRERGELADRRTCPFMSLKELDALADTFTDKLPSQVFSPADVQGYLLLYKNEPTMAVVELEKWMLETGKWKGEVEEGVKKEEGDDDEGSGVEVEAEARTAVNPG